MMHGPLSKQEKREEKNVSMELRRPSQTASSSLRRDLAKIKMKKKKKKRKKLHHVLRRGQSQKRANARSNPVT